MASSPAIVLPTLVGGQAESWRALIELAPLLGDDWALVGGQMVLLHEIERNAQQSRPTDDVDVVVDLRADPGGLARIHATLQQAGFDQDEPGPDGMAHRFRRRGAAIDVLAPDNLGNRVSLDIGFGRTLEAPGSTRALLRAASVLVEYHEKQAEIRRPDLVSAVVGKASAVAISSQTKASRSKHFGDFDALLRLLGPDDRASARLSKGARNLLRALSYDPQLGNLGTESLRLLLSESR